MRIVKICTLLGVLGICQASWADTIGTAGILADFTLYNVNSDEGATRQGRLRVAVGKGQFQLYSFGRTACNNKNLTDAEIVGLRETLGNKKVLLEPHWHSGLASNKCLVAYRLISRKLYKKLAQ